MDHAALRMPARMKEMTSTLAIHTSMYMLNHESNSIERVTCIPISFNINSFKCFDKCFAAHRNSSHTFLLFWNIINRNTVSILQYFLKHKCKVNGSTQHRESGKGLGQHNIEKLARSWVNTTEKVARGWVNTT